MNFVQNGRAFAVGLIIFDCALTVERCALLLITPFSRINLTLLWLLQDIQGLL